MNTELPEKPDYDPATWKELWAEHKAEIILYALLFINSIILIFS